jgi:protein-S-isoprenylcysteine O-methyltransferase Ste14
MDLLPTFQLGFWNGWVPLAVYAVALAISVSLYSKPARVWLFNNPQDTSKRGLLFLRLCGQAAMVAYIMMMLVTPLKIGASVFALGITVYAAGLMLVIYALDAFRKTPPGEPAVKGPYRISRNPQWVGLWLVLLGSAVAVGVWLYVGLIVVVGVIYHIQILQEEKVCIEKYGAGYRAYMNRVPRYLLL